MLRGFFVDILSFYEVLLCVWQVYFFTCYVYRSVILNAIFALVLCSYIRYMLWCVSFEIYYPFFTCISEVTGKYFNSYVCDLTSCV